MALKSAAGAFLGTRVHEVCKSLSPPLDPVCNGLSANIDTVSVGHHPFVDAELSYLSIVRFA